MITDTSKTLSDLVDRYSQPTRAGKSESHNLESLSKRILAPANACQQFIARGLLKPENTLTRRDSGTYVFSSDDLNDVRKSVLAEIVAKVIEESEGSEDEIKMASNHAVRGHVESFATKAKGHRELSRPLRSSAVVMLGQPNEEDQHQSRGLLKTAAKTAAVVGVGAGGLYGIGSLATHRSAQSIAQKYGQSAADSFLKRQGIGARIKTGWGVAREGTVGAFKGAAGVTGPVGEVAGAVVGAAGGAKAGIINALAKLRAKAGRGAA